MCCGIYCLCLTGLQRHQNLFTMWPKSEYVVWVWNAYRACGLQGLSFSHSVLCCVYIRAKFRPSSLCSLDEEKMKMSWNSSGWDFMSHPHHYSCMLSHCGWCLNVGETGSGSEVFSYYFRVLKDPHFLLLIAIFTLNVKLFLDLLMIVLIMWWKTHCQALSQKTNGCWIRCMTLFFKFRSWLTSELWKF